jgi:hypothetical protein
MFDISPKDWDKRYTYNVDSVVAAARQPIQTASRATGLLEASAYYDMLRPAHEAILKMKTPSGDKELAVIRSSISETTASARNTWQEFLSSNPEVLVVPGATPRSTGPEIESLRDEFEPYAQLVTDQIALSTL